LVAACTSIGPGTVPHDRIDYASAIGNSWKEQTLLNIDTPPQDAYVAVQYDRRWFWIADTDIQSKNTFAIIMLLFSIADTGVKGSTPIVTIPAQ
jgi:hypothetical protein